MYPIPNLCKILKIGNKSQYIISLLTNVIEEQNNKVYAAWWWSLVLLCWFLKRLLERGIVAEELIEGEGKFQTF